MTKPFPYQRRGARQINLFGGRALLADVPGLGKSLEALLYTHKHPEETSPIVVVCPAGLKFNWEREALVHFGLRGEVLEGTKPHPKKLLTAPLTIVNYEILWPWMDYLRGLRPQLVIIDECHYLAGRTTQRTKACKYLCRGVPHVVALSGTPMTSRPAELYPTLNILRPDLFGCWPIFADRFCARRRTPWGWDTRGASHLKELNELLTGNLMIRRTKEDVLKDLPGKSKRVITMPVTHPEEYELAFRDFRKWITQTNPQKLARTLRAEKLVKVGYLKRLAGLLKAPLVCNWVEDFLKESGEKLVLFAIHRKVLDIYEERFPHCSVRVDGQTTPRKRRLAVKQFQQDKRTKLFIGNIRAAGVGLTLTAASSLAFGELDWVPGVMSQGEDRIHRIGTKNACFVYYLVAHGTIEEDLVELLDRKQKTLDKAIDGVVGQGGHLLDLLWERLMDKLGGAR